jgi:hypothetical protein
MHKNEVEKLAQLRSFIINHYENLERSSPGVSMTKTAEVAYFCESLVASLDDLLKNHVSFSKK